MIDLALGLIATRLDRHLRQRLSSVDGIVALTGLTDPEGKPSTAARNRLVMFVTSISDETALHRVPGRQNFTEGRGGAAAEALFLNVDVMLAANFDPEHYLESLKILSHALQFFRSTPVFDHQNSPEMDARLTQLAMETLNLGTDTASQLWGMLGGCYVPSILYKMRLIMVAPES